MDAPDSNAYATGVAAASVNARAAFEEHDVATARKRQEFAAEALAAAKQRFQELEAAYKVGQKALDEATHYEQLASRQLEASLARLAEVRAPLHPVRKTPLELLGMIFEYCWDPLPGNNLLSEKAVDVLRRQRQPFQLAAVCRRWRAASLSSPNAWSCIELRLDIIQNNHGQYWEAYISCMLSRSAVAPLHLRIIRSRSDQNLDERLISPLACEMQRCESLLLSARRVRDHLDRLVPLLTAPTPTLRALHLMLPSDGALQLPNIIPHAPRLTSIRTSFRFAYEQTLLPAVTFVALYGPIVSDAGDDIGNALSVFPNANDVSLVEPIVSPNGATAEKVVCNNSLLRIKTRSTAAVNDSAFAERFTFPRLDYLFVYGSERGSAPRVCLVHSLLPAAVPQLTALTFGNIAECDIEPFLQGLHRAGRLDTLSLARSRIGRQGIRHICHVLGQPSDDGSWLCPSLTVLSLYDCTLLDDCPVENLVDFVERRNRAAAGTNQTQRPRRLVQLSLPGTVDRAITSRIAALL